MIAKAATISHGGNAIRYSVNKDKAEIVKVNFLPDDISAEAMYSHVSAHGTQTKRICQYNQQGQTTQTECDKNGNIPN